MANKVYVLVDCNNFFASCERLFRPDLEGKPVVVLSSNDGCVVARSNEAKDFGIPMGAPAFKSRHLFREHNIATFSANFELYGDISKRITAMLTTVTPRIEIYSVDESFLDVTSLALADYKAWGETVRASILKNVGVPVSIGIAPTKTLAKLASEIAKQDPRHQGVFSFIDLGHDIRKTLLGTIPVQELWGVGRKLAPKLRADGVSTALQLASMRPQRAQQLMGVQGRKMVAELNGIQCYGLEAEQSAAKSILRSRTFGEDTNQVHVLEAAIATLGAQAAYSLRTHHLLAKRIGLFTSTDRHKPGYRSWTREIQPTTPTNDTGIIIGSLVNELGTFFTDKQSYHILGVFLHDFVRDDALQTDILGVIDTKQHDRDKARMEALDTINAKWGKGKLYYAAEDLSKTWRPKHKIRSPRYVSHWDELPEARIV